MLLLEEQKDSSNRFLRTKVRFRFRCIFTDLHYYTRKNVIENRAFLFVRTECPLNDRKTGESIETGIFCWSSQENMLFLPQIQLFLDKLKEQKRLLIAEVNSGVRFNSITDKSVECSNTNIVCVCVRQTHKDSSPFSSRRGMLTRSRPGCSILCFALCPCQWPFSRLSFFLRQTTYIISHTQRQYRQALAL